MDTSEIMENNEDILREYFEGIVSCNYYDGTSYQLYFDKDNNTFFINHEVSDNTWLQRNDNSLVCLKKTSEYADIPEDEKYNDDCSLYDYEYSDWLDEIASDLNDMLE